MGSTEMISNLSMLENGGIIVCRENNRKTCSKTFAFTLLSCLMSAVAILLFLVSLAKNQNNTNLSLVLHQKNQNVKGTPAPKVPPTSVQEQNTIKPTRKLIPEEKHPKEDGALYLHLVPVQYQEKTAGRKIQWSDFDEQSFMYHDFMLLTGGETIRFHVSGIYRISFMAFHRHIERKGDTTKDARTLTAIVTLNEKQLRKASIVNDGTLTISFLAKVRDNDTLSVRMSNEDWISEGEKQPIASLDINLVSTKLLW